MFGLATPVQFGSGWVFYKEAMSGLRHRKLGMAAMVVLGTTAAYASSCYELVNKLLDGQRAAMSLDFDTSSLLITFVLMGYLALISLISCCHPVFCPTISKSFFSNFYLFAA